MKLYKMEQSKLLTNRNSRPLPTMEPWPIDYKNKNVGQVTSAAFSPNFQTNVALGMISRECWNEGDQVNVQPRWSKICYHPRKVLFESVLSWKNKKP